MALCWAGVSVSVQLYKHRGGTNPGDAFESFDVLLGVGTLPTFHQGYTWTINLSN